MTRTLLPLLSLALVLASCANEPGHHLKEAQRLAYERRPRAALVEYEQVLALAAPLPPEQGARWIIPALKGAGDLNYLETRKPYAAIEYYKRLIDVAPAAPEVLDARSSLSEIYVTLDKTEDSVTQLAAILETFPDAPDIDRYRYLTATGYLQLHRFEPALAEARTLLEHSPGGLFADDAQMMIATIASLQDRKTEALAAYDALLAKWPQSDLAPIARFEGARLLASMDRPGPAIARLIEALKTYPSPQIVQREIARIRKNMAQTPPPPALGREAAFAR